MEIQGLKRELTLRDVVLFNVAAILGLRWIPIAAATGFGSITIWTLAILFFFLPQGFAVAELSRLHPDEGGIYVWSKKAFGDFHGFICGWCYWGNNLSYYPSLLISAAGISALIGGQQAKSLADSHLYVGAVALLILWTAIGLNLIGMRRGKWVQNIGAIATWVPGALLVILGIYWLTRHEPATAFAARDLVPQNFDRSTIALWSSLCFALAGLELPSTMGGEIQDPKKTLPRAVLISGALIVAVYVLATVAVLVVIPQKDVSIITGAIEAITTVTDRVGWVGVGAFVALLITLGHLGGVGAWLAGTARIPFVVGLDKHLPESFGKLHPKWGTPYLALLVQGVIATLLLLFSFVSESVKGAYLMLLDMTIIVYFVPYLYMFLSMLRLTPQKSAATYLTAGLGFISTATAIVLALIPPKDAASIMRFELTVGGGALAFILVGVWFYIVSDRRSRALPS